MPPKNMDKIVILGGRITVEEDAYPGVDASSSASGYFGPAITYTGSINTI